MIKYFWIMETSTDEHGANIHFVRNTSQQLYNTKNQINWLWPRRDTVKYVIQVELPFTTMANGNWRMNGGDGGQMGKIV